MRAYFSVGAWFLLGGIALACSGTSFSEGTAGGGSGGSGDSSSGGTQNSGARNGGGGSGAKAGSEAGGSTNAAGADAAGADTGGTETGGTGTTGGTSTMGGTGTTGGDVSVGGDVVTAGTSSVGGGAGTSGGPPVDLVCPKNMPSNGGLCKDGLACSYGFDLRVACRNMAKCDGGKWSITKPACQQLHECSGDIKPDVVCDPQTAVECNYNGSQVCVCTGCTGAGPCNIDQYKWACAGGSGPQTCPVIPPNLGQACGGVASCPYGSCSVGNNVTATCTNQTWSWEQNSCPLQAQP